MRVYCMVEFEEKPLGSHAVTTTHGPSALAVMALRHLLAPSSWLPATPLSRDQLAAVIQLARRDRAALSPLVPEERVDSLRASVDLQDWQVSLANNVLDLLLQMRHGNVQLEDVVPEQLIPVNDAHTGCWGLIVADRSAIHLRVRSSDVTSLRAATENLLAVLRINQWMTGEDLLGKASSRRAAHKFRLYMRENVDAVIQSNRAGEQEALGQVNVLSRLGLVLHSATRGAASVLWWLTLALAAGSLVVAFFFGGQSNGWLVDWSHQTLDRVFTGAFGAALVASVTGAQILQAARRPGGRRVLIRWT